MVYSLVGKPFADWVLEHIETRNQKLMADRDLAISMDPDILRAFQASTHISSKSNPSPILRLTRVFFLTQR